MLNLRQRIKRLWANQREPEKVPEGLLPEEQQLIKTWNLGMRLKDVVALPGWQDVLDIMEEMVAEAEFDLMNYIGSDKEVLAAKHRRARSFRELFEQTQVKILAAIQTADEIPQLATSRPTQIGRPGATW